VDAFTTKAQKREEFGMIHSGLGVFVTSLFKTWPEAFRR